MKNQYFGDIHDYRKYGLLRVLQSEGDTHLLLAWMLTPDDGRSDGQMRSYLTAPERWSRYDPQLFAALTDLLGHAKQPSVSLIEGSGLLSGASYYSRQVPDTRYERDRWRTGLVQAAAGGDLVFFDPDNGIEVRSKPVGRRGSSKYVTWDEIQSVWSAGCSVLIYQHFRREPREAFAQRLTTELGDRTGAGFVEAFRTPRVMFLLAAQSRHERQFDRAVALLPGRWGRQIQALGFASTL